MPVLGSNIMIDLHVTADTDVDSIREAIRQGEQLRPDLSQDLRRIIGETADDILRQQEITECSITVDLEFIDERVPGAPRERIHARLDIEGEEPVLAAVDDSIDAPERARIADGAENCLQNHLSEEGMDTVVDTTVIVTPVQFR